MSKRKIYMIALFVLLLPVAYANRQFIDFVCTGRTKIPHAESRVMITFVSDYVETGEKTLEIYDPRDRAFLFELFGKRHVVMGDSALCDFGWSRISFVHKGRSVDFYPTWDGCGFVRYRGKDFVITSEENEKLMEICKKYRIKNRAGLPRDERISQNMRGM